jgi:hypothetical protein
MSLKNGKIDARQFYDGVWSKRSPHTPQMYGHFTPYIYCWYEYCSFLSCLSVADRYEKYKMTVTGYKHHYNLSSWTKLKGDSNGKREHTLGG